MKKRQPVKLSDQLRDAIRDCGRSRYKLAQETGISQATLSRLVNGKGGVSLEYLDKLGDALGLAIIRQKGE